MKFSVIIVLTAFLVLQKCLCYRILAVFPTPMHSHYTLTSKLVYALAERGHAMTFVTPFPKNNTSQNVEEISVSSIVSVLREKQKLFMALPNENLKTKVDFFINVGTELVEKCLQHPNVQNLLRSNRTFDLVMLPEFLLTGLLSIGHHFRSPVVLFSTMPLFSSSSHRLGDIKLPSYNPNLLVGYAGVMSFWERFLNSLSEIITVVYHDFIAFPKHRELVKQYVPGSPDLYNFLNNASLLLINSHMSSFEAQPQMPNIIEVGGFHIEDPKPLSKELQTFLNNSKNGVVLFSLGTNIKSSDLPKEKIEAILKVFAKLDMDILWKWEADQLEGKPKNVKIMKWLPQNDILGHSKIKGFITHGGLLSTMESLYHAVPLVGIPVFADQRMNIQLAKTYGYAAMVPLEELNENNLFLAINEILNNENIRNNARKRSKIMRDQETKPLDKAIYWIEYVVRHQGAPHLKYSGFNLCWYQRYLIDVIIAVFTIIFIFTIGLYIIGLKCQSFCRKPNRWNVKEMKKSK